MRYRSLMKAVCFDRTLKICDIERPQRKKGEVLIRVAYAGICNTDHEIIKGYTPNFKGILGHEFLGFIEGSDNESLIGKRATAEINIACWKCEFCKRDLQRHCLNRSVLGIINRNGAMAEYVTVPLENIVLIPPSIPDTNAIFIEPLAAAIEILEQINIQKGHRVLLIGDGKLGLLIAKVVYTTGCDLTVVGKHPHKLAILKDIGIRTVLKDSFKQSLYDIVIEASGNQAAFEFGLSCVKPRGTFILKSTYAQGFTFNPSSIVVNEVTLTGSRCGRFKEAIKFLKKHRLGLEKMISKEFRLTDAIKAFDYSAQPETVKVVLRVG